MKKTMMPMMPKMPMKMKNQAKQAAKIDSEKLQLEVDRNKF